AAITLIGRARVPIVGARGPRALDRVGGTSGAVPRTVFREVALVHRRATRERGGLERVVGARAAAPRARLRRVAPACRRPAGGPGIAGVVDAQRRGDAAIALIGRADIAIVGAGGTGRLDDVGGTRAARARTGLGEVALVQGAPARGPGVARRVLADAARAVAEVGRADVAVVGARRAAVRAVVARLGAIDHPVPAIGVVKGQIDLAEVRRPGGRRVRTVVGRQR